MHDGPIKSVKNFQQVEAINRNIGKKKLQSAQSSNLDTEPPMRGQYMWKLCWFAYLICLKTKQNLALQMILYKHICANA